MDIDTVSLSAEYVRAASRWPFIATTEAVFRLPRMLLFAVGSRETNLTNEVGDGGHGHGVWQLDDRSHAIPAGFDADVARQCNVAAGMLAALLRANGQNMRAALAAYNAGQGTVDYNVAHGLDVDTGTAHGDYSLDVVQRMTWLQAHYPAAVTPPSTNRERQLEMFLIISDKAQGGDGSIALVMADGIKHVHNVGAVQAYQHAGIPGPVPVSADEYASFPVVGK